MNQAWNRMSRVVSSIMSWDKTAATVPMAMPDITDMLQDSSATFSSEEYARFQSNILLNINYHDLLGMPVRMDFVIRAATLCRAACQKTETLSPCKTDKLGLTIRYFEAKLFKGMSRMKDIDEREASIRRILLERSRIQGKGGDTDASVAVDSFINVEVRKSAGPEKRAESRIDVGTYRITANGDSSDASRSQVLGPVKVCEGMKFPYDPSLGGCGTFLSRNEEQSKNSAVSKLKSLDQLVQGVGIMNEGFFTDLLIKISDIFDCVCDSMYADLQQEYLSSDGQYENFDRKFALFFEFHVIREYLESLPICRMFIEQLRIVASRYGAASDVDGGSSCLYDVTGFFPSFEERLYRLSCKARERKNTVGSISMRIRSDGPLLPSDTGAAYSECPIRMGFSSSLVHE